MAPSIKVGDTIPEGTFNYIAYTPELDDNVCPPIQSWLID